MALRMTRPTKQSGSSFFQFRGRVPSDVLKRARGEAITIPFSAEDSHEAFSVTVKLADEIKFSLRTREPSTAKARTGIAQAHLHRTWEAIRKGPKKLSHKDTVALAGQLYSVFAESLEDDPGAASTWEHVIKENERARKGEYASPLGIYRVQAEKVAASLERRFGQLIDVILAREALVIDQESRGRLLVEGARALDDAAEKLKRNAEGNYTPDPSAQRFPKWEGGKAAQPKGRATITSLLEGWQKEAKTRNLSQSTFDEYNSRIGMFRKWLGHDDAVKITADDVVRYKEHRLSVVSAKTVKDCDLPTLRAVLGWGKENRKVTTNAAEGITVRAPKKVKERPPYFTENEIEAILQRARSYEATNKQEHPKTAAAKRWLPWLCAYSGARIGEVAQLRKEDFEKVSGKLVYTITPRAGTVKTKEFRRVPLHQHLVDEGFASFLNGSLDGYLFLNSTTRDDAMRKLGPTKNRVRELIRTVVDDPRVAPNHGWRHTFKTKAMEAEISDRVVDLITGHAARTVGDDYRSATDTVLLRAIEKFPRYAV
jgi:integrase